RGARGRACRPWLAILSRRRRALWARLLRGEARLPLLERRRHLDRAVDDLRLESREACLVGSRDLRADLAERDAAVLEIEDEVVRVADQDLRAGRALAGACLVASDERVDRRDLDSARRADRVAAGLLRHQGGEAADEVALLLGLERDARDVRDEQLAVLVRER